MKSKFVYALMVLLLFVFSGCSKDDDFITISPYNISFVHADGSAIEEGECINPFESYAVSIITKAEGDKGSFKTKVVEYTVNGITYSMIFVKDGAQLKQITLLKGVNSAQIADSGYAVTLNYVSQGDFELVE